MANKRIIVINGPNLNMLGTREPEIYGSQTFEDYFETLKTTFLNLELFYYQSNVEGELINKIQEAGMELDGIVLNAGGFTHTSVAIGDAVASVKSPVIEVHISNVYARESYRHASMMAKHCVGVIAGFGVDSYRLALDYFQST